MLIENQNTILLLSNNSLSIVNMYIYELQIVIIYK